jgi:hypothetical protein
LRDIHAELEQWDYDAPTAWEPLSGDILIGVVKGCASRGHQNAVESLTVQEEETGLLVAVLLDSPDLVNLVKLQRPHAGERIGIKCMSSQADGSRCFVLMVDRSEREAQPQCDQTPAEAPEAAEEYDETENVAGATDEERSFIEQALLQDDFTSDPKLTSPPESDATLREIIRRQDEQIARQAENVRELERMLASAIPLIGNAPEPEAFVYPAVEESITDSGVSTFELAIVFMSSLSLALAGYLAYVLL